MFLQYYLVLRDENGDDLIWLARRIDKTTQSGTEKGFLNASCAEEALPVVKHLAQVSMCSDRCRMGGPTRERREGFYCLRLFQGDSATPIGDGEAQKEEGLASFGKPQGRIRTILTVLPLYAHLVQSSHQDLDPKGC